MKETLIGLVNQALERGASLKKVADILLEKTKTRKEREKEEIDELFNRELVEPVGLIKAGRRPRSLEELKREEFERSGKNPIEEKEKEVFKTGPDYKKLLGTK